MRNVTGETMDPSPMPLTSRASPASVVQQSVAGCPFSPGKLE